MASKILYVCQEITPYLPETEGSRLCRALTQAMQERGNEIRTFMPRYGCINERRHQLHEVIRLSGMNLIIDDNDHQLIIKVASIPAARVQIYFIDNDDYFSRKAVLTDGADNYFQDNDERAIFFARGVLETVKKLRWTPTVVHCHGWFTARSSATSRSWCRSTATASPGNSIPDSAPRSPAKASRTKILRFSTLRHTKTSVASLWNMPTEWLRHPRMSTRKYWTWPARAESRCSNTNRPRQRTFSIITTDSMKRFNNFRRMLLPVAALAATIGLTLGGCTKVDDTLGGNLIPDNQQMRAGYVQLPRADELNPKKYVETRLFQTDSIVSSNITYGYMGSMLNDTLGHRSAGFLSQMVNYYKVDSGYFGYMPIFDSAQILLKVTSFGRDSVTEQSFAVYEVVSNKYLTEKPIAPNKSQRDSTFYLNFDPVAEGVYNPDEPLFTFTLGGEGKYPSTTSAVTLEPTEAGKKYIRRLMLQEGEYAGDYSIYSADSLKYWVEAFKGLYIAPNPEKPLTEYGKGTIFATELTYSGLSVYGRNRVKDDPSLIKDTIGMVYYFYEDGAEFGNVSVNNVKHGYEEATIARRINIEEARETAENRPENPLVYVEGMGGVVTEMTFSPEFFAELEAEIAKGNADGKNFKTLAFSQVRMSIYFNDSDYEWEKIADGTAGDILRMTDQMNAYPTRLGMYTNYKTLTPISDYAYVYEQNYGSSVTLAYNGKINRSRGCYVMDITGYMQQLWNSYMEAKADAGGEVANIDWDKVKNRSVYIGPEAYSLYTTSFGVLQGMPTQAGTAEPNNAPIRFSMAYNLIK